MSSKGSMRLDHLARSLRGSLASLRAAAETLERYPDMAPEQRTRLHAVVAEESNKIEGLIDDLEQRAAEADGDDRQRLPAGDLLERLAGELSKTGFEVTLAGDPPDGRVAVGPSAFEACRCLAADLRHDFAVLRCTLQAEEVDGHLLVDWSWIPDVADAPALQDWQGAALERPGDADSLRPVARSHGGEVWFDFDRDAGEDGRRAHVRLLLPLLED